jgi:hypothetical protein
MRSTPTEMQSMNENDFECLAKTRVNTPPMAKMTDDGQACATSAKGRKAE